MLKLSANISLLFNELPLLDRIKAASDAGFSAIELHFPYDTPIEDLLKTIEKNYTEFLQNSLVKNNG